LDITDYPGLQYSLEEKTLLLYQFIIVKYQLAFTYRFIVAIFIFFFFNFIIFIYLFFSFILIMRLTME